MTAVDIPLTWSTAVSSWRVDPITSTTIIAIAATYLVLWRRSAVPGTRALTFLLLGCGVWLISACSFIGVYDDVLFWVRALQIVLIMMVAPFGLALGMPVTVLREAVSTDRVDAAVLASPLVTSACMLAAPWLIYLTGWYTAILTTHTVDVATRILLVLIGFGYFYARLQVDPVPRRYPQTVTMFASLAETLADGVLGLVLWQGSLIAADYYTSLGRTWGPSIRTDQTIGAGVLWILGDVVGLPFLMTVFARFRADERVREREVDAELDASPHDAPGADDAVTQSGLWWESDPELRSRFRGHER